MRMIKKYGEFPPVYAPSAGEVLLARRSASDKWVRAVVLDARRNRAGGVRIKLQWLESDPNALCGAPGREAPLEAGNVGWVVARDGMPPLIKYISEGAPSAD